MTVRKQYTIELGVEISKVHDEVFRKFLRAKARELFTTAIVMQSEEATASPTIAIFSDDFFKDHEEIMKLDIPEVKKP
jgi:hypothetical protein